MVDGNMSLVLNLYLSLGQVSPGLYINVSAPCVATQNGFYNTSFGQIIIPYIIIYAQADATAISNCTTFNGTIVVYSTFPGDFVLPKLQVVNGLYAVPEAALPLTEKLVPSNLTGLILPQLSTIVSDSISFGYMADVTTVWLPQLSSVNRLIQIASLPALTNLSDFELESSSVFVTGTNITSLALSSNSPNGSNGTSISFGSIQITDNPNLVNLSLALPVMMGDFNVSAQNISSDIMSIGGSFELFGCSRFDSRDHICFSQNCTPEQNSGLLPLSAVTGGIHIHDTQLTAIQIPQSSRATSLDISNNPLLVNLTSTDCSYAECSVAIGDTSIKYNNLTSVSGVIRIQNNPLLANLLLPDLLTIGDNFTIKNNPSLKQLDGFSVDFPQLEKAFNGFTLITSKNSLNCSELDNYYSSTLIRGTYKCTGLHDTSATSSSNSTNTTSPSTQPKSSKLPTGAKAGIGVGIAVIALLALGIYLFLKKFKVQKRTEGEGTSTNADVKKPELPQGGHHEKTELEAKEDPGEMDGTTVSWVTGSGKERGTIPRKPVPERHEML
ncbi:hypothetical protein BDZ45DRAFT_745052 [Acephala macrosclerotiorum]|nr:hypothetical protein BDZ45DRAFT_745052 [Acephala macrosclerotiorum]